VSKLKFQARLLDNTSCTEVAVPFAFSEGRTQMTLFVAKTLLANESLIPDPDSFQYFATTVVWKSETMSNASFFHVDDAPDQSDDRVVGTWSASDNFTYFCP
jgi:hypothetical protein